MIFTQRLMKLLLNAALLLSLSSLPLCALAEKGALYRYYDHDGVLVINDNVPPEFANNGYEVISASGQVLEVVEPAAIEETPEERQQDMAAQEREDRYILSSYSSAEDIARARDRKLTLVNREIEILESNLNEYDKRRQTEQERAADYQRSGRAVPQSALKVLEDLDAVEQQAKDLLAERKQERAETKIRFERYINRFNTLKGFDVAKPEPTTAKMETEQPPATAPEQTVAEKSPLSKSAIDPTIHPAEND